MSLAIPLLVSLSGCEVFVDLGLKNTVLEAYQANIPGNDLNFMMLFLPGYKENDPGYRYLIHFNGGDKCTGEYYKDDTLQYEVEGTWSLPSADVLRIDLDAFVDADFDISKLDKNTFLLSTEANAHGLPIDPPTTPLLLYIRKDN